MCDGDIGTHKKRGLCLDFCHTWYELCMGDNFLWRVSPSSGNMTLDFPTYDDPPYLIRPLYEMVGDVEEFCERMGFPVVEFEDPRHCFNGIPTASRLHLNGQKTHWYDMFTWPRNKAPLNWNLTQIYTFLTREPRIYRPFGILLVVIAVICTVGYFVNQQQMKIRDRVDAEAKEVIRNRLRKRREREEKRLKIIDKMEK